MGSATTLTTPKDQVDTLVQQIAEENGLEIQEQLAAVPTTTLRENKEAEKEDDLSRRYLLMSPFQLRNKTSTKKNSSSKNNLFLSFRLQALRN